MSTCCLPIPVHPAPRPATRPPCTGAATAGRRGRWPLALAALPAGAVCHAGGGRRRRHRLHGRIVSTLAHRRPCCMSARRNGCVPGCLAAARLRACLPHAASCPNHDRLKNPLLLVPAVRTSPARPSLRQPSHQQQLLVAPRLRRQRRATLLAVLRLGRASLCLPGRRQPSSGQQRQS